MTISARGSAVITGRSDSTLNRSGVRIGTAELYAVVDDQPFVDDSLVVHLDGSDGGPGELLLFVRCRGSLRLSDGERSVLRAEIRRALSPRHVPDQIVQVAAVPRTLSGKRLEVPVKRIPMGVDAEAASAGSLVDPGALDEYVAIQQLRRALATG